MKIHISRQVAALIVLTVILTTGFMAYGLTRLESTTRFREFLPKDSPAIKTTEEFENTFDGGGGGAEIILVKAADVTQAEIFLAILRLENEIRTDAELLEYIGEVNSYADYILPHLPAPPFSIPEPQLENYIQLILSNPSVGSTITRILSENRTTALIIIQTTPGFSGEERSRKLQRLSEIVETFQENYKNIVFELTGDQRLHAEIMEIMNGDNRILIPSAAAFVVVILFFTFRKLSDIGLSMLVVGLGAVWAVGAMGWLGMKFTMLHVALVPLLFGLGIDYSIHMLNRYSEERRDRVPPKEAVKKSIQTTGIAVILAAVTTMIGFGSFLVSDLSAMSSMGVFTALGIGFIFLLSVVFLPSALLLRDRGEGKIRRVTARRGKHAALVLSAVAGFAERHKKPIILLATALAALSLLSASSIQTAMSFETFLPEDVPAMRTMREISEQFGGQWTIVVLARGEIRSPGGLQEMVELENSVLREKENLITGSRSLGSTVSLIAGAQPSELSQAQIDAIINNEKILEPSQRKRLLSDNLAVIYFYMNPRNDKEMAEAIQAVKSCIQERSWNFIDMRIDGEPAVGGEAVIITEVIGRILSSTIQTTFFAIILCLAVVASAFRSLTLGLAALTPLLLTVSWEFGMLKILGWPLDVLTMGISALTIGVGIDYGIHIIHRFLEENKRKDVEFSLALETTVTHVGMSLLAAWATTIGVFGILALSRMPAMARFGGLTALVITLSFVSALVVLPSVLALTMRKSFTKRGF